MQVQKEQLEPTKCKLIVSASQAELDNIKQQVLDHLGKHVKVQGFREGKAPTHLIEKQLDPAQLQTEFLEQAVNRLYVDTVQRENLRPVAQPDITINKFVPFTTLEFTATVETVGEIKLADYKKIKLAPKKQDITAKDVTQVLDNLRARAAEKKEVKRAAKTEDEVIINFKGTDAETKESIQGADGKEYPLLLGSKTFIPGFEEELVGLKQGDKKSFVLTFPKDYGAKSLQNRKVNFDVTVLKVQELVKPKLDDAFAKTAGPFKTLAELKTDVKRQLEAEQQQQAQQAYDNELLEKIAEKTTIALPDSLIEEEASRMEDEEKRNLAYRGQTWQEHLKDEGVTEEEHHAQKRPMAELRVKVGLILGEIAQAEGITISPEELEIRVQLLKGQYQDPAMQAELAKDENRRDIHARMMTEKTIDKLRSYALK